MKILGCDLHAKQQTIAMMDTETGEFTVETIHFQRLTAEQPDHQSLS
jgi:hypothetical protein